MATLLTQPDLGKRGSVTVTRARLVFGDAGTPFDFPDPLPAGAILRAVHVKVRTAFNSGTSDGLEVGTAADPNRFVTTLDLQATGDTNAVGGTDPAPFQFDAATTVRLTVTAVGAASTAGVADVTLVAELAGA